MLAHKDVIPELSDIQRNTKARQIIWSMTATTKMLTVALRVRHCAGLATKKNLDRPKHQEDILKPTPETIMRYIKAPQWLDM